MVFTGVYFTILEKELFLCRVPHFQLCKIKLMDNSGVNCCSGSSFCMDCSHIKEQ
uniref:Uncharacterized protein n=1 Tax=Anguilla anguilla TaxID=7936 RepID=A0A0E9T3H8_ANGAN